MTNPSLADPYDQAAKAKLQRDKTSYLAFRAVDQRLHETAHKRRTEAAVKLATEDLAAWREDVADAKASANADIFAARETEDKAVAAAEFARDAQDAARKAGAAGTPEEATEKLTVAQNAARIAQDRARTAEAAARAREDASAAFAAARDGLTRAETRLAQAQKAAATPAGTPPVSDATIAANHPYMQRDEIWDGLSRADQKRVTTAARKVRVVPVPAEEVHAFTAWFDAAVDSSARRHAAQLIGRGIPVPLT